MKIKRILGWAGVICTVVLTGFWAWWGSVENFHEGWYSTSFFENLLMFVLQYLLLTLIFTVLALISLKWKWPGLILHLAFGVHCIFFFSGASFSVVGMLVVIPLVFIGLLYFFGDPKPKKWAYRMIVLVPLTIILAISAVQGFRVSKRVNDHDFTIRMIKGNGVSLAWAPRGPGWPDKGVTWEDAAYICRFLSEDGTQVLEAEQNIWRLPTVKEAVGSMTLHNDNAGGILNDESMEAHYQVTPDKETPLWDPNSSVIYYWTSDTVSDKPDRAYIIVYHGGVFSKVKTDHQAYLSFRAVKDTVDNSMN